jgi:hypothetical protein|tara:strand:- start:645 stop:1091 length:447 start_codon:yes stop_codon:yes gene_type:complete
MADLTVTLTESVTLQGETKGSTNTLTIGSVESTLERIVTCPASQTTTIATFNSNVYGSVQALDLEDTKYIRITNLDSANAIELAVVGAATLYQVILHAGHSHILGPPDDLMLAEADTSPSFGTMADVASIQVNPGSNAVKMELFVAGA